MKIDLQSQLILLQCLLNREKLKSILTFSYCSFLEKKMDSFLAAADLLLIVGDILFLLFIDFFFTKTQHVGGINST